MAEFDFAEWSQAAKLTPATVKALAKAELAEKEALLCVTTDMLQILDLSVGQYALLCRATTKLQAAAGAAKPAKTKATVTLDDLKADKELSDLLSQVEGIDGLLTDGAAAAQQTGDDQASFYLHNSAPKQGEKPLLIPEFVDSFTQPENDHEIARDGQTSIILRTSRSRPKLESIKIPAWSAANAKIMAALIRAGKISNKQDIEDYLAYTVKVSELFEVYDVPSVMLYDNQYRILQNRNGFRWGRDSEHLHSRFLRIRMVPTSRPQQRKTTTSRAKTSDGQEICLNFQNPGGCRRPAGTCQYAHVCITPGCGESHPQCEHARKTTK